MKLTGNVFINLKKKRLHSVLELKIYILSFDFYRNSLKSSQAWWSIYVPRIFAKSKSCSQTVLRFIFISRDSSNGTGYRGRLGVLPVFS